MFEIKRYSEADKEVWNVHVEQARNATFLLNRSYMDYHSDRFHDHSLMIFRNGNLYDLLPANEDLTAAEVKLLDYYGREYRLKNALNEYTIQLL